MFRVVLCIFLSLTVLSGCSSLYQIRDQIQSNEPRYVIHSVKYPGETLGLISLWYTGKVENWKRIQNVNPALHVHNIQIHSQIRIPEDLARRSDGYQKGQFQRLLVRTGYVKPARKNATEVAVNQLASDTAVSFSSPARDAVQVYRVKSIAGCEGFENTTAGLASCADLLDRRLALP